MVRLSLVQQSKHLIDSAELMPADKYGYRPTEAQMTFGKLMVHIVQTNVVICSAIFGELPVRPCSKLAQTAGEGRARRRCETAVADCTGPRSARVNDTAAGRAMMSDPGLSRASAMLTIANDWADHYSTAASYVFG